MPHQGIARVIVASSVGTVIEFYDFFIFAALASTIAAHFFPPDRPTLGFLSTLATYAVGLVVRPFGSLAFGRLGDTVGRKTTFLITLLMMGTSTAAIGVLPGYATLGMVAPMLLILLRVIQGLALGGEYAGAATYVAEHAPAARRGYYTSYIQLTPTIGLFASSAIVLAIRGALGAMSDSIGRKPMMLAGHLLAITLLYPIYRAMTLVADPVRPVVLTLLVFAQMVPFVIVYTPLAAYLVDTFPPQIRYTSISLPYNLGNGWFGGFLPLIATALVEVTGNPLAWLAYPLSIVAVTIVVGGLLVRDQPLTAASNRPSASRA